MTTQYCGFCKHWTGDHNYFKEHLELCGHEYCDPDKGWADEAICTKLTENEMAYGEPGSCDRLRVNGGFGCIFFERR